MCYDIVTQNVTMMSIKSLPKKTKLFIQLFYLGKRLHVVNVKNTLGCKILDNLLKLNLLIADGNNINSNYKITPFNNFYFLSGGSIFENSAYIGSDSFYLAKHLPFNFNATKVLDLCSGTGIQAILLARSAKKIIGVELSREVANIARFNVVLNNVENKVKILQGDLYEVVKNKKFDLVVSNPPFVPVPDTLPYVLWGKGGEDGLLIQKKIFTNINDYMTKNGIGLTVGMSLGDRRSPFILDLLNKTAKKEKLDIDILVYNRNHKWEQILRRSWDVLATFPNQKRNPFEEFDRIYNQADAEYTYCYLVRLRRGKGKVALINLFDKENSRKETEISEKTSLESLHSSFVNCFINRQYNKAISIYKNMERFSKVFGLKYRRDVFFILGVSYERLRRYKKAIIELRKAEMINPEEAQINFSLFKCYRNICQIEQADRELKKGVLKFKKYKQTVTKNYSPFFYGKRL